MVPVPRHVPPRLKIGQVWYRVAYWDYWYRIDWIDKYGNVTCTVWRPDGSKYRTKVWAYKFDQGWLVFNKVRFHGKAQAQHPRLSHGTRCDCSLHARSH